MTNRQAPGPEDMALFRVHMGDVRPLLCDRVAASAPRPAPYPAQTRLDEQRVIAELLTEPYDPIEIQPGDALRFCRPGVQLSAFHKLLKGRYRIGAEADLHGMTANQAKPYLISFIREARRRHVRCVRIIHGKGYRSSNQGPVIKPLVNHWLRRLDAVLAFCSARQVDGGTGAVYVLLKRQDQS